MEADPVVDYCCLADYLGWQGANQCRLLKAPGWSQPVLYRSPFFPVHPGSISDAATDGPLLRSKFPDIDRDENRVRDLTLVLVKADNSERCRDLDTVKLSALFVRFGRVVS